MLTGLEVTEIIICIIQKQYDTHNFQLADKRNQAPFAKSLRQKTERPVNDRPLGVE